MYIGLHVKYPLFLSDFDESLILSTGFSKNSQICNSMKIGPLGADLFHADRRTDGWTDLTMLIVAFLNFANAP